MTKRIDCDRCMRLYREFRPAAVRIADENYCLQCVRSESLDVEDGAPIVQPTPANTPMGVPKVPDVPAPAPRKAAPVAEKKESEMDQPPVCKTCKKTKLRRSPITREYGEECTKCKLGKETLLKPSADGGTPGKKRGPKPKAKTIAVDATRHGVSKPVQASAIAILPTPGMATISVPAEFIQKYWNSLTLGEQAQLINQHIVESRA